MADKNPIVRLEMRQGDNHGRTDINADIVVTAAPPALGEITISVGLALWTGDNPAMSIIRERIIGAMVEALSKELPSPK